MAGGLGGSNSLPQPLPLTPPQWWARRELDAPQGTHTPARPSHSGRPGQEAASLSPPPSGQAPKASARDQPSNQRGASRLARRAPPTRHWALATISKRASEPRPSPPPRPTPQRSGARGAQSEPSRAPLWGRGGNGRARFLSSPPPPLPPRRRLSPRRPPPPVLAAKEERLRLWRVFLRPVTHAPPHAATETRQSACSLSAFGVGAGGAETRLLSLVVLPPPPLRVPTDFHARRFPLSAPRAPPAPRSHEAAR